MTTPKDPINYSSGVGKINTAMQSIELDAKAVKAIGSMLNFVNKKLIDDCLRIFTPNNADAVMRLDVAVDAVKKILSGELQKHALAEGNRFMCLYNTGFIDYQPGAAAFMSSKDKKEKTYQEKQIEGTAFAKGLSGLVKTVFPEAAFDTKGKKMLCKVLAVLAKELSEKVKIRGAKENVITQHDVKAAVEEVLPIEMASHAIPEGTKMTTKGITLKLAKKLDARTPGKKVTKSARPDSKNRKKTPKRPASKGEKRPPPTSMAMSALPKKRKMAVPGKKIITSKFSKPKKSPRGKKIPKVARKSRTVNSKQTSSRKRTPSKAKRTVSRGKKRPASTSMSAQPKRRKMGVPAKKRTISNVSKEEKSPRGKRTPSKGKKKPVSKGKKRPPSTSLAMSALPKRKKMSVPEKKKSGKKIPKVARKSRPKQKSADKGKRQPPAAGRTRDGIGPKALKDAVKSLSKQPLSQDALKNISNTLSVVSEKLLQAIKKGNSSNIGPNEIRNAVKELFRGELETTAMARLTQVTATSQ